MIKRQRGKFLVASILTLIPCIALSIGFIQAYRWVNKVTQPQPTHVPILLFENNCKFACWEEIQIGKTTEFEIYQFFRASDLFDVKKAQHRNLQFADGTWSSLLYIFEDGTEITFFLHSDILEGVSLLNFNTVSDIKLKDTLDALGSPEYITQDAGFNPSGGVQGGIFLYYPTQGYIIRIEPDVREYKNNLEVCYDENAYVTSVDIYPALPMNDFIRQDIPSLALSSSDVAIDNLMATVKSWQGYGCFDVVED